MLLNLHFNNYSNISEMCIAIIRKYITITLDCKLGYMYLYMIIYSLT